MAVDVFSAPPQLRRSLCMGWVFALAWSSALGCGGAASAPAASEPMPNAPPPPRLVTSQPPEEAVEPTLPPPASDATELPTLTAPDPTETFDPQPAWGRCEADAHCGVETVIRCSVILHLCYETTYGYVFDPSAKGGQGAWATPPSNVAGCGPDLVFWPLINSCYDPISGYAWNPATKDWVYVGDSYTAGPDDGIEPGPPPTETP
jgi:hypothetical protein